MVLPASRFVGNMYECGRAVLVQIGRVRGLLLAPSVASISTQVSRPTSARARMVRRL